MNKIKTIVFDEQSNAIDYLEKAYFFIKLTQKDPHVWKWVTISLHGALYGFAICACKGTSSNNVTIKTKKEKLIYFDTALKNCQDSKWVQNPLKLSNQERDSIRKLKDHFRNNFEHFIPKSWIIPISIFPNMSFDVLTVIRFLALKTGIYTDIYFNSNQKKKIKSYIFQSKKILKQNEFYRTIA